MPARKNQPREKLKTITLDTSVSSDFLQNTLTQDISTLEALFDMIDNSIDAARDEILSDSPALDAAGLPDSYQGYKIKIRIDDDSIRVWDNCSGITEGILQNRAFKTGETSSHEFGIGYYGLGLKRALLKAGTQYAMLTDNGQIAFKSFFDNHNFGGDNKNTLTATGYPSLGVKRTVFSVSHLHPEIKNDIRNQQWFENAVTELSKRYSIYINKGLSLEISNIGIKPNVSIDSNIPSLRKKALVAYEPVNLEFGDVTVQIHVGIHEQYTFPTEESHSVSTNKKLTDDFGLYFVCNDRVIVAASTEKNHGFGAKWHSEYNGLVCMVTFVSKDAGQLPWNTAKTALKIDSAIFLKVKKELTPLLSKYRSDIKKRYPNKKKPSPSKPQQGEPVDAPEQIIPEPSELGNASADNENLGSAARPDTRIQESQAVVNKLAELGVKKLSSLYQSLVTVSLVKHPALMYVGAWSFMESLSTLAG